MSDKWLFIAKENEASFLAEGLAHNQEVRLFSVDPTNVELSQSVEYVHSWRPSLDWADYIWPTSYDFAAKLEAASPEDDVSTVVFNWHPAAPLLQERSLEAFTRLGIPSYKGDNGIAWPRLTLTGFFSYQGGWSPWFLGALENAPEEPRYRVFSETEEEIVRFLYPFSKPLAAGGYIGAFSLRAALTNEGIFAIDILNSPSHGDIARLQQALALDPEQLLYGLLSGDIQPLSVNPKEVSLNA